MTRRIPLIVCLLVVTGVGTCPQVLAATDSGVGFLPGSYDPIWQAKGRNYDSDTSNFELLMGEIGTTNQTFEQFLYWGSPGSIRSADFTVTYTKATTTGSFWVDADLQGEAVPAGLSDSGTISYDVSRVSGWSGSFNTLTIFARATEGTGRLQQLHDMQLVDDGGNVHALPDVDAGTGTAWAAVDGFAVDLSEGFTLTGTVTYRTHAVSFPGDAQTFEIGLSDTAVPEPSAMVVLASLGLIARRRKHRG